jgi:hypothetical protein
MNTEQVSRLQTLEKKLERLTYLFVGSLLLFIVVLFGIGFTKADQFGIIRAKGIIIEDEKGKDRVLIGAPIPYSKNRVRTDSSMVRKYWAKKYGANADQFMKWYADYYHGAEGIVIMNEEGFDRVLLGDKLADPNSGKRMFESAGITWNDKEGWELGGAGVNTGKDGKSRAVIGVDDSDGEAVHIVALEDGTKGLMIGGANGRLMVGMARKNGEWFQNKDEFTGIRFFDTQGKLVWEQPMEVKK